MDQRRVRRFQLSRAAHTSAGCLFSTSTATGARTSSPAWLTITAFAGLRTLPTGKWTQHVIDNSWSQAHASLLVDINGDGHLDFVTGKRYMAHNGNDPGEREPLGVYWYEYRKAQNGSIEWIRHIVSYGGRMGGGMQIAVVDLDGDGDLDVVSGGKSGVFFAENLTAPARGK